MITGVGELTLDVLVSGDEDGGGGRIEDIRGGGTFANVLANAAAWGGKACAVAVHGDDWRGQAAAADTQAAGVRMNATDIAGRLSHTIFQVPVAQSGFLTADHWRTVNTCPVCDSTVQRSRLASLSSDADESRDIQGADIVCVDRLSASRLAIARSASRAGAMAVADVGHRGYVRYIAAADLRAALMAFDLIQAPAAVATMIATRLGVRLDDLADVNDGTWIVTAGAEGVRVMGKDQLVIAAPAPDAEVVDTIGAGDALLGGVLAALESVGPFNRPPKPSTVYEAVLGAEPLVTRALSSLGARGHLTGKSPSKPARSLISVPVGHLRSLSTDECPLCGYKEPIRRGRMKVSAPSNVSYLAARVRSAVSSRAVQAAATWLADPRPTVVCGSGGSYPAAELISDALNDSGGCSFVRHPAEHLAIPATVDRVLCVSYSGTNRDIETILHHAVAAGADRVGLLTINPRPPIADIASLGSRVEVLGYNGRSSRRERGFVSIAATVAPAAVWVAAAHGADDVLRGISTSREALHNFDDAAAFLMAAARSGSVVEIIATGWARPAALDLESKMTESATVAARLHDTKDFSHGRFLSVLETTHPRLLITVGKPTPYQMELAKVLRSDMGQFHHLGFDREGSLGALDALIAAQHIAVLTADFSHRDLSRPETIPKAGLALYKWEGPLP